MPTAETTTVLVLIKGLGVGGAERLIAEAAALWDRRRFRLHVAYVLPWKDQLVADIRRQGLEVTCIGSRLGMDPLVPWRLRRLIRRIDAHLVHAHLPATGIVARLFAGVPVVYTEHNLTDSYRLPTRWLNLATYRLSDRIVAVSEAVAASGRGRAGHLLSVVPNAVDVTADRAAAEGVRVELGLDMQVPLVVHVGNIRPHKGHETLVAASRLIADALPEATIVSVGGEKYPGDLQRLTALAAEAGLEGRLQFLGRRLDAQSFLAAATVVVNPADVEGLPIALLEAMGLGRPVVATDVGGVPSVVIEGRTGRLVPPKDPERLAAAVLELVADPDEADRMGRRAAVLVREQHGMAEMVARYERVFEEVLGEATEPARAASR